PRRAPPPQGLTVPCCVQAARGAAGSWRRRRRSRHLRAPGKALAPLAPRPRFAAPRPLRTCLAAATVTNRPHPAARDTSGARHRDRSATQRPRLKSGAMADLYAAYPNLELDRPAPHVLRLTLRTPGRLNAVGSAMHGE